MTESLETNRGTEEERIIEKIRSELGSLSLDIKKESFKASQRLKDKVKGLWFYDWDESWENIKFNIVNVKKYLESIKDKSWSDLDVKSSELDKWVRTIAIQIAINYINQKNWWSANKIDWIDGLRGNQTWKWVKEFQVNYSLKIKDGLPWHETINKILELLEDIPWDNTQDKPQNEESNEQPSENLNGEDNANSETTWENKEEMEASKMEEDENNIDDSKCTRLVNSIVSSLTAWYTRWRSGWDTRWDTRWNASWNESWNTNYDNWLNLLKSNTKSEVEIKSDNKWQLKWTIVYNNPWFQTTLNDIVAHVWDDIKIRNQKYQKKGISKNRIVIEKNFENSGNSTQEAIDLRNKSVNEKWDNRPNKKEAIQSWEEYEQENCSKDSFEAFVASEEWIAIILEEIKAHIDPRHVDENGQYDRLYENYPFSRNVLEVKLRNAWETKMQWNYKTKNGIVNPEKEEEMEKFDTISNQITWNVDKIIWEYLKSGKENFDQDIIWSLEDLLAKWIHGASIFEICSDQNQKDAFKLVLTSKIKNYSRFVRNNDDIDLNTWDKQLDFQLKGYLYIYWVIFYSKSGYFKTNKDISYYEEILPDLMKIIAFGDDKDFINKIKHKELLKFEKKIEEERKMRDQIMRQEIAERNNKKNEQALIRNNEPKNLEWNLREKNLDLQNASGLEIAMNQKLWAQLPKFELQGNEKFEINKDNNVKREAFRVAFQRFIEQKVSVGQESDQIYMKSVINLWQLSKFYNSENNTIDSNKLEEFINKLVWYSDEEKDQILKAINQFPNYVNNAVKQLWEKANNMVDNVSNDIKMHAIGALIDNVKNIFSQVWDEKMWFMFQWFEFNEKDPVTISWSDMLINWKVNWTDVVIRYNLYSWELFINSLIMENDTSTRITIWNKNPDYKIWELESFDKILNNYYEIPTLSVNNPWKGRLSAARRKELNDQNKSKFQELFWTKLDIIGDLVKNHTEKQCIKNSIVNEFLITFNITRPDYNDGSDKVVLENWSNLFDLFQIIERTNDSSVLSAFYENIKKISKYSWLERWKNNENQNKKNWFSEKIFDTEENEDNERLAPDILYLKRKSEKFYEEKNRIKSWNNVFGAWFDLWFADIIKDKMTEWTKPDWKLDIVKMNNFVKLIENESTVLAGILSADKDLDASLAKI